MQRFTRAGANKVQQRRLVAMLALCGSGSLGIFLLLTLHYSLEQHILMPLATLGSLSGYAPEAVSLFGLAMLLLVAFYGGAYWAIRRAIGSAEGLSERAAQMIVIVPILALLTLLHLYPITSLSVINQAIQIRVLTVHHANPLLVPAGSFPGDPFTSYDDTQNLASPYGPLWLLLSVGPAWLAGENLLGLVLLEKLVPILFLLGCQRLVWLIANRVAPHRRWQALLLFSWNPLLLFETAGNGHNEVVGLFFVLLAFYCLLAGPGWLSLPTLALALLVNSLALIFLPLVVVAPWLAAGAGCRARGALAGGGIVALGLVVGALLPFGGTRTLPSLLQPFDHYATSLPTLLHSLLQPFYGIPLADQIVKVLAGSSFFLWYLVLLTRLSQRNFPAQAPPERSLTPELLLASGYEVIFWFLVLAALAFGPWLILWLLPFAALAPPLMPWVRTTILATCGLLSPLLLIFGLHGAVVTELLSPITVQFLAVLGLFGPVLGVRVLEAVFQRRRLLSTLAAREAALRRLEYQLSRSTQPENANAPRQQGTKR